MFDQTNVVRALLRGCLVLAVSLGAMVQPVVARVEADVPPPLVPRLVKTINSTNASGMTGSCCGAIGTLGSSVLFGACDGLSSCGLWRTDGSEAGTTLVKANTSLGEDITLSNTLYFGSALDGYTSYLWRSDATEEGTYQVSDVRLGSNIVVLSGTLYFVTSSSSTKPQLWKSDGTANGTMLVKDFNIAISSSPYNLVVMNKQLYLLVYDWVNTGFGSYELWKSDGTSTGTVLVTRLTNMFAQHLTVVGNKLFFAAGQFTEYKYRLWMSDGTAKGTAMMTGAGSGEVLLSPKLFTGFGDELYFQVSSGASPEKNVLWRTDGTAAGTFRIFTNATLFELALTAVGKTLYFFGDDGIHGTELMKTDGTAAGTVLVKDMHPGSNGGTYAVLTNTDNGLLFFSDGSNASYLNDFQSQLWVSDGSSAGTFALANGLSSYTWAASLGDTVFVPLYDARYGIELWKTDGTVVGTHIVKDINQTQEISFYSRLSQFTPLNGELFFAVREGNGLHGARLWQSDSTLLGTQEVVSLTLGYQLSELTPVGDLLYFVVPIPQVVPNPQNGSLTTNQLWRTDGTLTGTVRLLGDDVVAGFTACGKPGCRKILASITGVGNTVYFVGLDSAYGGSALWRSDGTPAGTVRVKNVYPSSMTSVSNTLYFQADNALWKSDGTSSGTQSIPITGYFRSGLTGADTGVFFLAGNDFTNPATLWKSDGTATGTVPVPLPDTSGVAMLAGLKDALIFLTPNGKLWRTDGTLAGSQQIGTIDPSLIFVNWTVAGSRLFMTWRTPAAGTVLMATDGTPAGTQRLLEVDAFSPSAISYIAAFGDGFIFVMGNDLWVTDGTTNGTYKLMTLHPNYVHILDARNILLVGNTLYFEVLDTFVGDQLWSFTFSSKPDARLTVPVLSLARPTSSASVDVDIANIGIGAVQSVTLTATLCLSLTYVSDTSGVMPTVQGNMLVWNLPNLGTLTRKAFNVSLGLPNSIIGLHYPITFTLGTNISISNAKTVEIVAAATLHMPLVFR